MDHIACACATHSNYTHSCSIYTVEHPPVFLPTLYTIFILSTGHCRLLECQVKSRSPKYTSGCRETVMARKWYSQLCAGGWHRTTLNLLNSCFNSLCGVLNSGGSWWCRSLRGHTAGTILYEKPPFFFVLESPEGSLEHDQALTGYNGEVVGRGGGIEVQGERRWYR